MKCGLNQLIGELRIRSTLILKTTREQNDKRNYQENTGSKIQRQVLYCNNSICQSSGCTNIGVRLCIAQIAREFTIQGY